MVGGGAEHSTNISRVLSYAAFGGREGIIGSTDLEVRALGVPGGTVRVAPGACAILNRAAGIKYEAYAGRLPVEDTVDIAPTTAGGGRTDLIIARVENPFITGEPYDDPPNPKVGPYMFTRVISNVPSGIKSVRELGLAYSALTLAKVTLPASTGTVQQSHITDLRVLSQVLRQREQNLIQPTSQATLFQSVNTVWPWELVTPTDVPEWATHVYVHATITGIKYGPGNVRGDARIDFGGTPGQPGDPITTPGVKSQVTVYDESSTTPNRTSLHVGGRLAIPVSMRGKTVKVMVEARKYTAADINTSLVSDVMATCWIDLEYTAAPQPNA
jgi:hypothetical protein